MTPAHPTFLSAFLFFFTDKGFLFLFSSTRASPQRPIFQFRSFSVIPRKGRGNRPHSRGERKGGRESTYVKCCMYCGLASMYEISELGFPPPPTKTRLRQDAVLGKEDQSTGKRQGGKGEGGREGSDVHLVFLNSFFLFI